MRRLRASSLLVVSSLASAWITSVACSSSGSGDGAPVLAGSTGPDAGAGVAFALEGVYVVTDPDAGVAADPMDIVGDVWRFHDGAYSFHPLFCAADTYDPDAGSGPDADPTDAGAIVDDDAGDDDAGDDDDLAVFPSDVTSGPGCDQSGTYVISADGTTLSLTDAASGMTTTEAFVPIQWLAPTESDEDDDAGVASQSAPFAQAGEIGGGVGLVTPGGKLVRTSDVTLVTKGGKLLTAVGCSGVSPAAGAATGAFVRLASDIGFSCLQSQLTLPAFDIPTGPNGAAYCTSFSQKGCTTANYYGRHGVGFIYDEFLGSGNPAECGFEYMPGLETSNGLQGAPRWVPYVRGDSYYHYGQSGDGSVVNGKASSGITGYPVGTAVTLLCTVDATGHLQMKINGAPMYNVDDTSVPKALLASPQSFSSSSTHVMRVTAVAWPETMTTDAGALATLMKNQQFFPPYTCQPLNKLSVLYTSSLACTSSAGIPSAPYNCGSSGNATWSPSAKGIGYTLTPTTEVTDVPNGNACTDTLFPSGG